MNNNFGKLTRLFRNNQIDINACLDNVNRVYRPLSPAIYLYNKLITYHGDKFNRDFIELVYVTLDAWNMNSRGAKLLEFGKFENSILDNKNLLLKLKKFNIRNIELAFDDLHELFNKLKLVETKAPLVTFTKTLHFMLPELVVPIDRKYTLSFFGINNYQLNNNSWLCCRKVLIVTESKTNSMSVSNHLQFNQSYLVHCT